MGMMTRKGLLDCSRLIFKYYVISWAVIPNLTGAWVDSYMKISILLSRRHVNDSAFMDDNVDIVWFE
jgi:hypothetical protein